MDLTRNLRFRKTKRFIDSLYLVLLVCGLQSCSTYKHIPYFEDVPDSAKISVAKAAYQDLTIEPDDILTINIQTLDPTASAVFNLSTANLSSLSSLSSSQGLSTSSYSPTYLVDKFGRVDLPMGIGQIKLSGLTTVQAHDTIESIASKYYKGVSVNIRFADFKVTVLGEVNRPGTYVIPNERATVFDALGLAGDVTIFGKRENAVIMRDSANKTTITRFSLNSKDLVSSDKYYLKQNDVIYVEPNMTKIANLDAVRTRNITLFSSITGALISLLVVFFTRVK